MLEELYLRVYYSIRKKRLISNCKDAAIAVERPGELGKTRSGKKYQCEGKKVSEKDAQKIMEKGKKCNLVK